MPLLPCAHKCHHLLGVPVPDVRDDAQRVEAVEEEVAAESLPTVGRLWCKCGRVRHPGSPPLKAAGSTPERGSGVGRGARVVPAAK